ncbi:MAG: hypothetical protein DRJ32_04245 [Thermoprotei archaeon]|nr:MAG: hypothetical protein DRJ32_04245 [Thermoprotei archaeon]
MYFMTLKFRRNRTPIKIVKYAIYLYLSGLSLRKIAERLRDKGVGSLLRIGLELRCIFSGI